MAQPRQLYRLPEQGIISGVLAGLGRYLDIDVTLTRLLFILITFVTGIIPGIIAYIIMAVIIPVASEATPTEAKKVKSSAASTSSSAKVDAELVDSSTQTRSIIGWLLVFFGAWYLLGQLFPGIVLPNWSTLWPLILIVFGFYIISKAR